MEYKIEKGIKLTQRQAGLTDAVKSMKVGDSLLIEPKQRSAVYLAGKLAGFKTATRNDGDKLRAWRVA